jgi:hypothetical protein
MSSDPAAQLSLDSLQFDRAEYAGADSVPAFVCACCAAPIAGMYYHFGKTTLCAGCGKVRRRETGPDRSAGTFLRAAALGLGVAVVGALLYYGIIALMGAPIALLTIAIGWQVGRGVARATGGRSTRRHRVMAVALTYFSLVLAYTPFAMTAWQRVGSTASGSVDSATAATLSVATSDRSAVRSASFITVARAKYARDALAGGRIALALVVSVVVLTLPLLVAGMSMPGGILSIFMMAYGLRMAWANTAPSGVAATGPYAVGRRAFQ